MADLRNLCLFIVVIANLATLVIITSHAKLKLAIQVVASELPGNLSHCSIDR